MNSICCNFEKERQRWTFCQNFLVQIFLNQDWNIFCYRWLYKLLSRIFIQAKVFVVNASKSPQEIREKLGKIFNRLEAIEKDQGKEIKDLRESFREQVNSVEPLPGGGTCSQDPLTFLDFIPCSPLLKPLVPKNDFSSCSLDPQNYCAVPLIPRNFYPCSPYLFTCFTFLFIVKEIAFEPPLSSPCNNKRGW